MMTGDKDLKIKILRLPYSTKDINQTVRVKYYYHTCLNK